MFLVSCFRRGCQFQATENATKTQNTTIKTYGKLSLFIFLSLYQHLGSKGAKFCFLWSISRECGCYEIQLMYGITCRAWHHNPLNSTSDGLGGIPRMVPSALLDASLSSFTNFFSEYVYAFIYSPWHHWQVTKTELKSKRLLQRLIKQREKGWDIQYFDCMANTSLHQVY